MRILQVISAFYPPYSSGGAARPTYDISKRLVKRGHTVTVYTTNILDNENLFHFKSNPHYINGIETWYFTNKIYNSRKNIVLSLELIKSLKNNLNIFDLVHFHEYRSIHNLVIYYYAKKNSVPYILQARGSLPTIGAWQRLKCIYDVLFGYRLLKDASKVIALGRVEAQQYKAMGVPEEKIAIIPNGIDLSEYANLPSKGAFKKKFKIDENKKIILYLGRIHRIKGIDVLVKAFADVIQKLDDVRLVVVGPDDGYLSVCQDLVKKLNIEGKVLFTGPLYGKAKLEAYVDADVFALPSRYEIFGNVVLESYACFTPVVATRVAGLQEIVFHRKTGLLVKPGDVKELASAILILLTDDKVRIRMGMRARRVVEEKFSLEKVVDKLEAVYGEVIRR